MSKDPNQAELKALKNTKQVLENEVQDQKKTLLDTVDNFLNQGENITLDDDDQEVKSESDELSENEPLVGNKDQVTLTKSTDKAKIGITGLNLSLGLISAAIFAAAVVTLGLLLGGVIPLAGAAFTATAISVGVVGGVAAVGMVAPVVSQAITEGVSGYKNSRTLERAAELIEKGVEIVDEKGKKQSANIGTFQKFNSKEVDTKYQDMVKQEREQAKQTESKKTI
jgi:hypothetical protein